MTLSSNNDAPMRGSKQYTVTTTANPVASSRRLVPNSEGRVESSPLILYSSVGSTPRSEGSLMVGSSNNMRNSVRTVTWKDSMIAAGCNNNAATAAAAPSSTASINSDMNSNNKSLSVAKNGGWGRKLSEHWYPTPWEDTGTVAADNTTFGPDNSNSRGGTNGTGGNAFVNNISVDTSSSHASTTSRTTTRTRRLGNLQFKMTEVIHHPHFYFTNVRSHVHYRSWKRRFFLFMTEPDSSRASAIFYVILIICIAVMNAVMMMQTCTHFQYTPTDCRSCGGPTSYLFDDDEDFLIRASNVFPLTDDAATTTTPTTSPAIAAVPCQCPPTPMPWTDTVLRRLVYFFTAEWCVRLALFTPPKPMVGNAITITAFAWQWVQFLTSPGMIVDALAIFPYYVEMNFSTNGLMSLRLIRLFRVLQLVRLGQFNRSFVTLTAVMHKSLAFLNLLLGALLFGAAFFGSMMYWLERGEWKYYEPAGVYAFVRIADPSTGQEEISPFHSIPVSFWWYMVTATTVGYGDMVPKSTAGQWVATVAMLSGVLVIAFPVSIFSDLWSKEMRKINQEAFSVLDQDENDDNDDVDDVKSRRLFQRPLLAARQQQQQQQQATSDTAAISTSATSSSNPIFLESIDSLPDTTTNSMAAFNNASFSQFRSTDPLLWHDNNIIRDDNNNNNNTTATPVASVFRSSDYIMMHKDDVTELIAAVHQMHESQRDIRRILQRYQLSYEQSGL